MKKQKPVNDRRTLSKKDKIVLALALCMVLIAISGVFQKKNQQESNIEQTNTATTPPHINKKEEKNDPRHVYKNVEEDVIKFVRAYTALTNGSFEEETKKCEKLSTLMTPEGAAEYLQFPKEEDRGNYKIHENLIRYKFPDSRVYITGEDARHTNLQITVVMLSQQIMYRNGNVLAEYPYMFRGTFEYDEEQEKWLCNTLGYMGEYSTNFIKESQEPQGD